MEVLLENTSKKKRKGGKLEDAFIGPYYINKAVGKGIYQLRNRNGNVLKRKINIAKPYMKRKDDESVVKKCCVKKDDGIKGSEVITPDKRGKSMSSLYF